MMTAKLLKFALLVAAISLTACQADPVKEFYFKNKNRKGVHNVHIGPVGLWMGRGIVRKSVDEPALKPAFKLLKKVNRLKLMYTEECDEILQQRAIDFAKNTTYAGYDELIKIRDGETFVDVIAKENGEVIKDVIVIINDGPDLMYLHLDTNIKYEDIIQLLGDYKTEFPELDLNIKEIERNPELIQA